MPKHCSNNPERLLLVYFQRSLLKTEPNHPWLSLISEVLDRKTARELAAERKERIRVEKLTAKFLADPGALVED